MSKKQKRIFWPTILAILTVSSVLVLLAASTRARPEGEERSTSVSANLENSTQRAATPPRNLSALRNLSLQPGAFRLSHQLGQRFNSSRRGVSVIMGTLITAGEEQPVRITRAQSDRGERVEIATGGRPASMSWSKEEGSRSSDREANELERTLIERLAFDSVDQFVLAQLRGASYYIVARNVRPSGVGGADDYHGPVWDIVRVDDREPDTRKRALSSWRLYYVNTQTGLIDKVVCELRGERIQTNFVAWVEQAGEKIPSRIAWTRQGQTIMEFNLTNFAHDSQR